MRTGIDKKRFIPTVAIIALVLVLVSANLDGVKAAVDRTYASFSEKFDWLFVVSNLAAFMRQLYLSPCASGGRDGLGFVFGKSAGDWSDFPRETSMQRAFHRLRESGRRLKEGGMFIESRVITVDTATISILSSPPDATAS